MRRTALAGLIVVGVLAGALALRQASRALRWRADREQLFVVARDCQPVLDAIHAYRAGHHRYPRELRKLVPAHLAKLPAPPSPSDRDWEYAPDPTADQFELVVYLPGSLYPYGWHFWTALVYESDQQYNEYGYGGGFVERIGAWAFYVE
jgi:hypothetical protein